MCGQMVEYMMDSGSVIRCMVKEYIHGLMAANMKVTMLMIKNMGLEYILGQMVENTKEVGFRVNNMATENTLLSMVSTRSVLGNMAKEPNGFKFDTFLFASL